MEIVHREILLIRLSLAFPFISISTLETAFDLRYLRASQAIATLSAPCSVRINPYRKRLEAAPASSHRCATNWLPSKIALAKIAYKSCMLSTVKPVEDPAALAPIDWTHEVAGKSTGAIIVIATGTVIEGVELLSRKCIHLSVIGVRQLPPR
jgi:hypothetical protein